MSTFNYPNAGNSDALNALLADLAAGIEPRACIGCGCTDADACVNPLTGEACRWVQGIDMNLCSACASIALRMADEDEYDAAEAAPRVQLYTEGEANREIADRRAIGGRL